jgi:hypothetical protein
VQFLSSFEQYTFTLLTARAGTHLQSLASIKELCEFRQTVFLIRADFPFSSLFGRAISTRADCVECSALVYNRLVGRQMAGDVLRFATLAEIATNEDGLIDTAKMKRLFQLLRPDNDRTLTLLVFTKVRLIVVTRMRL